MLKTILSSRIYKAITNINPKAIIELRLRTNKPIQIRTTQWFYLCLNGLTMNANEALACTQQELEDLVFCACNHSVFAHNDELKQGFLTLTNGMRIGISGELVFENGEPKTIKNFSSVNIRFAKEIKNCSLKALKFLCEDDKFLSTLVVSPPNCGKTTFIRDLCYQLSSRKIENNLLVVDERNEICASLGGVPSFDLGESVDFYSYATKKFGIINGIRTMSPDVIVVDELATKEDLEALLYAVASGVKIIATVHSQDYQSLALKPLFDGLNLGDIFDRFVVLSNQNGIGTVESIFNKAGLCLYCGS